MSEHTVSNQTAHAITRPHWVTIGIAGFFGLLYAAFVWLAVVMLIQQSTATIPLNGYGWFVLIMPIAVPMIIFIAANVIGRKRAWPQYVMTLITGLCLTALFWISIIAYAMVYGASLLSTTVS